jgi:methylthioribose-1-phosphate isomerase
MGVRKGEDPRVVYETLKNTRPTAYNLFYALNRMMEAYERGEDLEATAKVY